MHRPLRVLLAAAAFAAVTAGCASVPMARPELDLAAKRFDAAPTDRANVYVYRNESIGGAVKMTLLLNGQWIGDTGPRTFLLLPVAPGAHTLVSKTENDAVLQLVAEPGRTYYVWQEVKMGMWAARSALHLVDEATGRTGVQECSLATGAAAAR